MRLKPEQLSAALAKNLAPVYLISGDEPLQVGESCDTIRAAAKAAGFLNREVLSVDNANFQWYELTAATDTLSIFADKKIIDLRLVNPSPGNEGAKALMHFCQHPPDDTVMLISTAALKKEALKSRWFQAVDQAGVVVQVWPLDGQDLLRWLNQRLQNRGLQTDAEGLQLLASRIEGNLLAAAQEIEKLYVLYGKGFINTQQLIDAVADSSRYDVFKLMDTLLAGDAKRVLKILVALKAEGIAAPVVLWGITREARNLIKIKLALDQGQNRDMVFKNQQVWDKRKALVNAALARLKVGDLDRILLMSAKVDRKIKGQESGDVWESLLHICLTFACQNVVAIS